MGTPKRKGTLEKTSRTRPKRSKFNVAKNAENRTYMGIVFDSELEMRYYRDIVVPAIEKDQIVFCELQKTYILQPAYERDGHRVQPIKYVADFFLKYVDGHEEIIDTKGYPDAIAKLKKKMFLYLYPDVDYRWVCYSQIDGGWCDYDWVLKQRKDRKKKKELEDTKKRVSSRKDGTQKVKVN